jgi:molybdopterin-guanine dinucleotide biosynthesis protein A
MVAACDMPFASPALFAHARDLLLETGADAVVPSVEHGLEPLHAVYRRANCLPAVLAALEAGERRLISWFEHIEVRVLDPAETARLDPSGLAFWNLNTPEEFQQAEEIARREKPPSP